MLGSPGNGGSKFRSLFVCSYGMVGIGFGIARIASVNIFEWRLRCSFVLIT